MTCRLAPTVHGAANSVPLFGTALARGWLRPWAGRWVGLIGLLFFLHLPASAESQELVTKNPNKLIAGFLRNFAHYVTWPTNAFTDEHSPWKIGILGDDPFGDVLEKTFKGRTEQGRAFEVFRAATLDQLPRSQIIFVAYKDAEKRRAALAELKTQPVLTVGNAPKFLQEGGIIRFKVKDQLEMSINLDQARSASLNIQTKMLEVSHEVLENGVVQKLR
jgi:YfiR/HmsC-like